MPNQESSQDLLSSQHVPPADESQLHEREHRCRNNQRQEGKRSSSIGGGSVPNSIRPACEQDQGAVAIPPRATFVITGPIIAIAMAIVVATIVLFISLVCRDAAGPRAGYRTRPAPAVAQAGETASREMKAICRAHHVVSSLPLAHAASWPTLTEFLAIDVTEPPFSTGPSSSSCSHSTPREDCSATYAELFSRQKDAILRGWVTVYEGIVDVAAVNGRYAGGAGAGDDWATQRVADAMLLVAVTLQDPDARLLYIYDLLPKMEDAAGRDIGNAKTKKQGKGASAGSERERKAIMMSWLKRVCVGHGAWPLKDGDKE
ncbi:hypothetical protein EsH8_XIII_000033 [Colletotrichum jinshuiense]